MLKSRLLGVAIVLSVGTLFALPNTASAQQQQQQQQAKKLTYEQAFKACKAELDKTLPPTADNQVQRYERGGACLAKFGYRF